MKEEKNQTVVVVGLGYVGLPLAIRARQKGYRVIGYDPDRTKTEAIRAGRSPFEEKFVSDNLPENPIEVSEDEKVLAEGDIVLICVPTPVDKTQTPVYDYVITAAESSAKNLKKGALVVLESTVNPGVSEEIVRPIFEKAGHKVGEDVFLAHCPERINPGDPKWNVTNIARVVGAFTPEGTRRATEFYRSIVDAEIRPMKSIREAEAVKVVENSFRDINIAFVNELAQSFDKLGIDIVDVIRGAATKPFAFMPHYPSCGVGGHCIPVDPYYLIEYAKKAGFDHRFMRNARAVNNSMPLYTVNRLQDALNEAKMPLNGTRVGVLGLSYKPNVDDTRESPAFVIIRELKARRAKVLTFDPHIPDKSDTADLKELFSQVDALLLVTAHDEFKNIRAEEVAAHDIKVVVDGQNHLNKDDFVGTGIIYRGIGRGGE